ncbi:MAG: LPD38 domain-containing protein [Candidatus Omnitrophota bacterium]|jgi:hypothetical protein
MAILLDDIPDTSKKGILLDDIPDKVGVPITAQKPVLLDDIPDVSSNTLADKIKTFFSEGFVKPAKTFYGGTLKASADLADTLDFYSNKLAEKTGLPKPQVFDYLKNNWNTAGAKLQSEGISDGLIKDIYSGLGKAAFDVPVKYMGPGKWLKGATLPVVGAAEGFKEGGVPGAATGAIGGAATQGAIKGLGTLPTVLKIPAAFTTGAVTTPGTPSEKVAGGAVFAGLSAGKGPSMEEFKTTNPIAKNISENSEGLYQNYINRFASIENIAQKAKALGAKFGPGEDPSLRARSYLGIGPKVQSVLEDKTYTITPDGQIRITGEGLKPILSDYDKISPEKNIKSRNSDLTSYLISRRTIMDLQRPKSEFTTENIATPEQVKTAQDTLGTLNQKYKGNIQPLEQTAQRLYDYQKRVLRMLVDSGNMSEEMYQGILTKNPNYVPFDRVIDEGGFAGITPVNKNRFSGARSPIKRIKGSELEIHNPIESMIKNTYRIMDISERNNVARSVARLGQALPEDISPVKIPIVPLAKAKLKAQIDPVLQNELIGVIGDLKGRYSRRLNIGGPGLGYFQEPNKIRTRFASREDVIAHELGHYMDKLYGLKETLLKDKEINKELQKLSDMRYEGQDTTEGYKKYVRKGEEKIAALMDAYVTKPFILDEIAPKAKKAITAIVENNKELAPLLKIRPSMVAQYEKATQTIWGESPFKPKGNIIEYFENGKRSYIEVTPNLYQAMTGLNETSASLWSKILSKPANLLRTGATITPEFMGRNFLKDQVTAAMQTKLGFRPIVDSAGAIADIMGKSDIYYDWLRSGGAYSSITELSRSNLQKMVKDLQKMSLSQKAKEFKNYNIIARAQDVSQLLEQATRLGIYKKATGESYSPIEAGFQSREGTVDFARRGAKMKDFNSTVAFFNAGIQGLDKTLRMAKADLPGITAKGIAMITIPSIMLYLRNRDDPEYNEIPRWKKDMFWMFKVGSKWAMIPKTFLYGQIFGSLPERFFEYLDTKDKAAFNGFKDSMYNAISPVYGDPASGMLATGLKPFVENGMNKNFFTGRGIVPEYKKNLLPAYQYNKNTSETAKLIGKTINYSPAKIENTVQGFLGNSGRYALQAGDQIVNAAKRAFGQEITPKRPIEVSDIPGVKGFITGSPYGGGSESVKEFYDNKTRLTGIYESYKAALRDNNAADIQKIKAEHPEWKYYFAFNDIADSIKTLNNSIDKVVTAKQYTDKYKRDTIQKYETKITELAAKANKLLKR